MSRLCYRVIECTFLQRDRCITREKKTRNTCSGNQRSVLVRNIDIKSSSSSWMKNDRSYRSYTHWRINMCSTFTRWRKLIDTKERTTIRCQFCSLSNESTGSLTLIIDKLLHHPVTSVLLSGRSSLFIRIREKNMFIRFCA